MTDGIGRIMSQRPESESVFVQVLRVRYLVQNEIAAPDVMHKVAEEMAAEGIVADVLYEAAAVGVGVSFAEVGVSRAGVAGQQYRTNLVVPEHVDDLLMGEDGVGWGALPGSQKTDKSEAADEQMQAITP